MKPYIHITLSENRLDHFFIRNSELCSKESCSLPVILDVSLSGSNLEFTRGELSGRFYALSTNVPFNIPLKECGSTDPDPSYTPNEYALGDVLTDVTFPTLSNNLVFNKVSINYTPIATSNIVIPTTNCLNINTTGYRGLDNTEVMNGNVFPLIASAILDNDGLKFTQIHVSGSIFDNIKNITKFNIPLYSCDLDISPPSG